MQSTFVKKLKQKSQVPILHRQGSQQDRRHAFPHTPTSTKSYANKFLMKFNKTISPNPASAPKNHNQGLRVPQKFSNDQSSSLALSDKLTRIQNEEQQMPNPRDSNMQGLDTNQSLDSFDTRPLTNFPLETPKYGKQLRLDDQSIQGTDEQGERDTPIKSSRKTLNRKKQIQECQISNSDYERHVYVQTLQRELSIMRGKCSNLNNELINLAQQREREKADVGLQRQNFALVKQVLTKENEYYKNQYKIARKMIAKYKEKLGEECTFDEEALTVEEKTLIERIAQLVNVVQGVSGKVKVAQAYIQELKDLNMQWQKELGRVTAEYERMLGQKDKSSNDKLAEYELKITQHLSTIQALTVEKNSALESISVLKSANQQSERQKIRLQECIEALENQSRKTKDQLKESQQSFKQISQSLKQYVQANQQFAKVNAELHSKIEDLRADNMEELDNFNKVLADLIYVKSSDIHIYRMTISQLKAELKVTKDIAETTKQEFAEYQKKIHTMDDDSILRAIAPSKPITFQAGVQTEQLDNQSRQWQANQDNHSQYVDSESENHKSQKAGQDEEESHELSFQPYQDENSHLHNKHEVVIYSMAAVQTDNEAQKEPPSVNIQTLWTQIRQFETENQKLRAINQELVNEMQKYEARDRANGTEKQLELQKKESMLKQAGQQLLQLEAENNSLKEEFETLMESQEQNQISKSRLQNQVTLRDECIQKLEAELADSRQKIEHLDSLLKQAKKDQQYCPKCEQMLEKLDSLETELRNTQEGNEHFEKSLNEAEQENQYLKEQVKRLRSQSRTLPNV